MADIIVPPEKATILHDAEDEVHNIERAFRRGRMSENERYSSVIRIWEQATNDVTKKVMDALDEFNPINMMATSGARGSINQIRQLAGMRGLMASAFGQDHRVAHPRQLPRGPVGAGVLPLLAPQGPRKSLADTALRTADSGYMTRRLVDVSQENIVREVDCFAAHGEKVRGLKVSDIRDGDDVIESLNDRIRGRWPPRTSSIPAPARSSSTSTR